VTHIPRKNNFDLLRLALAFSVCLSHLGEVSGTQAFHPLAWYFYSGVAVDCFFVVSGFLIFRSYQNSSGVLSYMNKRVRRIYPAYLTVVLLSALFLPLLADATRELYLSPAWFRYLLSNLGFMNFLQTSMPTLFMGNPLHVINAPLWTIKVEVMFYLSVPLIFILLRRWKKWLVLTLLYVASIAYSIIILDLYRSSGTYLYLSLSKQLPGQLTFFLGGGAIYLYYPLFRQHLSKLLPLALIFLAAKGHTLLPEIYPLALAIAVISFALCLPSLGNWGKYGDISYGVYIYHFPIIQVFTALDLFRGHPWTSFVFLILCILFTSFLSYHLIEKPFLRKSSHYRLAEKEPHEQQQ
jgi:peptidoglycan/LPS O-acetylase OafA/YrhL